MGNVINFTNDTTLDMQLPGSLITVHVQDVVQNPIANAHVTITNNELGTPIAVETSIGPIQFGGGNSSGGNMGNSVGSTDSAGNITLPFFPINVRITVVPSGNILASTFVNKSVPQDTSTTITLQNIPVTISISGHITDRT